MKLLIAAFVTIPKFSSGLQMFDYVFAMHFKVEGWKIHKKLKFINFFEK